MSANTPGGFPYMEETDPLASVANAIEELALACDPHAVMVSRATAFAIPNAAFTDVPMTVEDSDVHGQAALAGGVYTVTLTEAGIYRVSGQIGITGGATGNARGMQLLAGGVAFASSLIPATTGAPNVALNVSGLIKVGLATVIKMQAFQNNGAALNTIAIGASHATLSAHRIAKAY